MAAWAWALVRAAASFAYWLLVLFCFYGAVAGDRRVDAAPLTFWQTHAVPVAIILAAILIHAALTRLVEGRW